MRQPVNVVDRIIDLCSGSFAKGEMPDLTGFTPTDVLYAMTAIADCSYVEFCFAVDRKSSGQYALANTFNFPEWESTQNLMLTDRQNNRVRTINACLKTDGGSPGFSWFDDWHPLPPTTTEDSDGHVAR